MSTQPGQDKKNKIMTIGVVIPTKNRINYLLSAVRSVLSQSRLPDELIIVDQSTTDAADSAIRSLLTNHKQIDYKYIFNNTLTGLTAAKNVAVKASGSDILLFIDDDIVLDDNFIQIVLGVFEQRPELSGVGGVVQLPAHRQSRLRGLITSIFRIGPFKDVRIPLQYGCYTKDLDVIPSKFLSGGLSALRRDLFQHVEFDGFLKGASVIEDLDFYSRANGFKFALARRAVALHNFSTVSRAGLRRSFEQKCAGFVYVFYNHIPKTPHNIFAFFWRNVGFFLDAISESLRYRTFDPILGSINGWRQSLKKNR
jgi:glycosyltransferase involved in cell wall biosynthesis